MDYQTIKVRAYYAIGKHPEKIIVEFDCGHQGKKYRHHYNYNKPFNIQLLCGHCHMKVHHPVRKIHRDWTKEVTNIHFKNFPDNLDIEIRHEAIVRGMLWDETVITILSEHFKEGKNGSKRNTQFSRNT